MAYVIGQRWGVTDQEVGRFYPCDDLAPSKSLPLWRGITVNAAAGEVWPWLCQLRLAPYSYDWIDNLGKRSPRELRAMPDPQPGEPMTCSAGRFRVGRVLSVAHEEHVTGVIMGALMSYVLSPEPGVGSTRLLLKVVIPGRRWYASAVGVGDWPMARRQLKNFKALAERSSLEGLS